MHADESSDAPDAWDVDGIDAALLSQYVLGLASLPEQRQVRDWAASSPARGHELERWRRAWAAQPASVAQAARVIDAAAGLARVREAIDRDAQAVSPERDVRPSVPTSPHRQDDGAGYRRSTVQLLHRIRPRGVASRWVAIATALVVAWGLGLGVSVSWHRTGRPAAAGRDYTTVTGQRLSVTLADGTRLTLAPASKVHVAAGYGRSGIGRAVDLEGEVYFAVVHDAAQPFSVRTRGAVVRDVGTAFDVRAYPEDNAARIAVAEGAVAISTSAGGAVRERPVRAGDVATVGPSGVAVEHGVDVANLTAWATGRLVFDEAPLRDVVADLSRWYGAIVMLGDTSLNSMPVTTTATGQPVDEVLRALATSVQARVERRNGGYVLVPVNHAVGRGRR